MTIEDKIKAVIVSHEKKTGEVIKSISLEKKKPIGYSSVEVITITVEKK